MEDSARDPNNQRPKREYPARNPGYQPKPRPKRGLYDSALPPP